MNAPEPSSRRMAIEQSDAWHVVAKIHSESVGKSSSTAMFSPV